MKHLSFLPGRYRICMVMTSVLTLVLAGCSSTVNEKPFVIPEIREWQGNSGYFTINSNTVLALSPSDANLQKTIETFAKDYQRMFEKKLPVEQKEPRKGDISFKLAELPGIGPEGYTIRIGSEIAVEANTAQGIFWATRTLLQLAEQNENQAIPKGTITDFPQYATRGFMIDCGRKFFTIDFLRDYVKLMAYYKMNCFQIHLNDNGFKQYFGNDWDKTYAAFRLESSTFPGLAAKDGHYTKQEFIDLQKLAEEYQVTIIPEIDVPAHSLALTHYRPEIGSKEYGMDHLDLFRSETYAFVDSLFAEYLSGDKPVFRGKAVHIGTDEYSNKKQDVVEKFRAFTDHYIRFVESFGKQAYVWGALTHAKGETPVKSENVVMNAWYNGYADPKEMVKEGYKLISIPDGLVYIVPAAGYYHDYLNIEKLYEEWTPAHVGEVVFEENDPAILGGMFAVWNDHAGNGISAKDVHHRVFPAMQTLSAKMWSGVHTSLPFDAFNEKRHVLSEAPGVNIAGKIGNMPELVYEQARVLPGDQMPYKEIGYNYSVEFDIVNKDAQKGTVLFRSPHAIFYLSDPETGKLGFEREGYLNTFDYAVPEEKTRLRICGDSASTRLYVNEQLQESLDIQKKRFNNGKDSMSYVRTLVFPLEKAGSFVSEVSNLKVYNYIK